MLMVYKTEMWGATVDDRAGAVADSIEPLSQAGADFEFIFARRTPERPGKGIVFVTPVKGTKVANAARASGFQKRDDVVALRVEGMGKPGVGAAMMRAMSDAGISVRALSAASLGRKFVAYVALDNAADANRAAQALRRLG